MRMDSLLAGAALFAICGCVAESRVDENSEKESVGSSRIIVTAKWVPGVLVKEGVTSHYYNWTLEKGGRSRGSILNTDYCTTITSLELPPTAYDEFLELLEKTQFFEMKSAHAPREIIDGASKSIEVAYQGRKHVVTKTGAAEIDPGFNRMWMLIRDLQDRSTIVTPNQKGPERE